MMETTPYNDVNPFCLIVSFLDCFTLRVRNDGDVRRVIAKAQPEAIQQSTSFLFFFRLRDGVSL
jgi:hypothetical protein